MQTAAVKLFLTYLLILSISGCTQYTSVSGNVYDASDGSPIEGAHVALFEVGNGEDTYTDKEGYFSITIIYDNIDLLNMAGSGPGIEITKENFHVFHDKPDEWNHMELKVFLERL